MDSTPPLKIKNQQHHQKPPPFPVMKPLFMPDEIKQLLILLESYKIELWPVLPRV